MSIFTFRGGASLFSTASFAALTFAAAPAFAQAPSPQPTVTTSDEIIVVGVTKQEENLQEVPTTITAFSGETLTELGVRSIGDIATFTPGFNIRGAGNNPTAFALSMRGQIQNDNIATLEPSVGTYIDGVYVARAYGLNVDMLDVSNVQVLKGPQGTLFGRNTSAGAVLIQTNDPVLGETSGSLAATVGRFNEQRGTAVLNFAVGDNVAIRGAFTQQTRDGYKHDLVTGREYEGQDTFNYRLKVAIEPTEALSVLLSADVYDGEIQGPARQGLFVALNPFLFGTSAPAQAQVAGLQAAANAQIAIFRNNPDLVGITQPATVPTSNSRGLFTDTRTETYIAKATLDTGVGQLQWINGVRRVKSSNLVDLDGLSVPLHFTAGYQDLEQVSTELQLTGQAFSDRLNYAAGVTYFEESGTDTSRSSTFGSANWSNFTGDIDNSSVGVYVQGNYALTDALSVTAGVRMSSDDKGVTTFSGNSAGNGPLLTSCSPASVPLITGCARSRSDSFDNTSYTIGVDFKLTDDILLFAKQSTGYRAGAQQLRTLTLADTTPAAPEEVSEQEVGVKSEFFDGRLRLNAAVYHNDVTNAQRSVILAVGGTSQTILENADTKTWGGEADLFLRVTDSLDLFATVAMTNPEYKKYNGFVVVGGVLTPNNKMDTDFTGIVENQYTLGANFDHQFGWGRFKANASYAWQDEMNQTEQTVARLSAPASTPGGAGLTATQAAELKGLATTRAYGVTNARASLSFGPEEKFEVALWGRNIFDERATQYSLFLGGINYLGTSYNEPQTYGLTGSVKF